MISVMETLEICGLVATAILLGSMLFFSLLVAPLVFIKLDAPVAGHFIRALFPWYYGVVIALSTLAALALAGASTLDATILALVAIGGVFARQGLMPRINRQRDRMLAGNRRARRRFDRLHRASVWLNAVQIVAVLAVLVRLAIGAG